MEFKTKKKEEASVKLTVKNNAEEVEEAFQEAYVRARPKVKVPGFRKGKVPLELVEKHLGDSVAEDAIRNLIAGTFQAIAEELDPPPISIPQFEVETFERGKGATYSGLYDTHPEVKLNKYKKVKVTEDYSKVTDESVSARVEELRKENALIKTREGEEVAQDEDIVTMELELLEGDNSLFKNEEFQYPLNSEETIPALKENLLGAKTGEEKTFDSEFPESFGNPTFAGKKLKISYKIKEIKFPEYPDVDDEFAKDVGEYEDLADLRTKLKTEMEEKGTEVLKRRARNSLLKKIADDTKFSIPRSIITEEMNRRVDMLKQRMGVTDPAIKTPRDLAGMIGQEGEQMEKEFEEAAVQTIKENLVLVEIARKEEIIVDDEAVAADIKEKFGGMLTDEQMKEWMDRDELKDNVRNGLQYTHTLDWVYEQSEVKKGKEIPYETLKTAEDFS